jgi:hypothetical protein
MRRTEPHVIILRPTCQGCGEPLKRLGHLPSFGLREPVYVLVCTPCKIVETTAWYSVGASA